MKKLKLIISIFVVMTMIFSLSGGLVLSSEPQVQKIVVFKKDVAAEKKEEAVAEAGGQVKKQLNIINGVVVMIPSTAAEKLLSKNPNVLRIDDDIVVSVSRVTAAKAPAAKNPSPAVPAQPAQVLPWGIDRIDAEQAHLISTGTGVKVAVIDTGVDINHPDLKGVIAGGINTISAKKSYQDDNGHGTHVSGIIGAANNSIGVVGVAPQVKIYAVKALDRSGNGWLSDIIEGLQWAVANNMQVVNMSLGSNSYSQSFRDAVSAAYKAGIVIVAAAGNDGPYENSVSYPAAYPGVIAVSAVDTAGKIADFSSRGPEVDIAAPGVNILSTWNDDFYNTISGTSMAAPHVAGTAALVLAVKGPMTPDELESLMKAKAENINLPASQQGAGLIDAHSALQ